MKNTLSILAVAAVSATALADSVTLNSGETLTGTLVSGEGSTINFKSDALGSLAIKAADIKSLTSDKAATFALKDGTSVEGTLGAADGKLTVTPNNGQAVDFADVEAINPAPNKWKVSVVGSAAYARGNTENETYSLTADAEYSTKAARTTLGAGYFFALQENGNDERETTADNWFLKGQEDIFLSAKLYVYGNLKYERDRIANLDRRITAGAGLGYQWLDKSDLTFKTEVGGAYVYERTISRLDRFVLVDDDLVRGAPSENRESFSLRFAYALTKNFSDAVKCFHNLEYLPSTENFGTYLLNADLGAHIRLSTILMLELKADWRYNSKPLASGAEKLDSRYTIGLGATF